MTALPPVPLCARGWRHCASATSQKSSSPRRSVLPKLAANCRMKWTTSSARWRRNISKPWASITKISPRRAMKKCASCWLAPRKVDRSDQRQVRPPNEQEVMDEVRIPAGRATLNGGLTIVDQAKALVLFAHGSGSSRDSPRNQFVARRLNDAGLATLLFDLLTPDEEAVDLSTRKHRFNIKLLAERLLDRSEERRVGKECRSR